MKFKPSLIISRGQSLQILRNELRKSAMEKHASELASASTEQRREIIAQIEDAIETEMKQRRSKAEPRGLIH